MFCGQCGMELEEGSMFCPNCGCKVENENAGAAEAVGDSGASMNGQYNGSLVQENPGGNIPNSGKPKKTKVVIGIIAAVLLLGVGVFAAVPLFGGPKTKVLRAITSTMKDAPELINDLGAVSSILTADQYTAGIEVEADEANIKAEFRNAKNAKQLSVSADLDDYGDIDVLCGVHSGGIVKASLSELNYVFFYDPKADNDGFLCKQIRSSELDEINEMLEDLTSDKGSIETLQKNFSDALKKELKELEFKEAKTRRFKIDGEKRECKGYRIRINEKNLVHVLEYMGETTEELRDVLDELCDEIKDEEFDADITFYLYKKKLAAVIVSMYDDEEVYIAFQGGEYRMQNISIGASYDGDDYEMLTVSTKRNKNREVIEIEGDGDFEINITYDTKSGDISCEYDDGWSSFLLSGVYEHSGSEASFTLEELEVDGDSLIDDISFTAFVKKKASIEEYKGKEFDLGSADEDDFEDLMYDLEDYADLLDGMIYGFNRSYYDPNYYRNAPSVEEAPAEDAPAEEEDYGW